MGAPWAPSYACLHLGLWKEEIVYRSSLYLSHSKLWLSYIDDVFMVWAGTVQQLSQFMEELNINNRNLRVTYSHHHDTLPFLDLTIGVQEEQIVSKTIRKKTAANTLQEATSHHPHSLIQGIAVGQFLRIKRNFSLDKFFLQRQLRCMVDLEKGVTRTNASDRLRKCHLSL